jgi:hypothetical protein
VLLIRCRYAGEVCSNTAAGLGKGNARAAQAKNERISLNPQFNQIWPSSGSFYGYTIFLRQFEAKLLAMLIRSGETMQSSANSARS